VKIIARERARAERIVAKYAARPGVMARELSDALAVVAKYQDADRRAARFIESGVGSIAIQSNGKRRRLGPFRDRRRRWRDPRGRFCERPEG
jgi:hypothetical protein